MSNLINFEKLVNLLSRGIVLHCPNRLNNICSPEVKIEDNFFEIRNYYDANIENKDIIFNLKADTGDDYTLITSSKDDNFELIQDGPLGIDITGHMTDCLVCVDGDWPEEM